jgi:ribonuclease III
MGLTSEEKALLKRCEKRLGYRFKRRGHLKRALTHRSLVNELRLPATEHNERYEYLGDAVLELAVSHLLMERFPEYSEGELSKLRAAVVNEAQLAEIARDMGLGEFLCLGKGEDQTGGRDKPSLLSDAFEAVLGAVYLDRGFGKPMGVIDRLYRKVLERAGGVGFIRDFKTRLQEVSQARFRAVPSYRLQRTLGPDHAKTFEIHLYIHHERWGIGHGASKKAAEQAAAAEALAKLEGEAE